MDFVRPELRKFAYKMEGLDEQWIETDASNRVATYTTLPAGDYLFKVKASFHDGSWDENFRSVKVTITPPWWASNIAYVVYVLLAVWLVWFFNWVKTRQLRQSQIQLQKGIELRTAELKQRTETIAGLLDEKDQLLNDKSQLLLEKDRLFSNVSHEFRTPLTLILNPVENWLRTAPDIESNRKLTMIKRNANRLLRLVEQLLALSKLNIGATEQRHLCSMSATLNPLVASFEPLLADKCMTLTVAPFEDIYFELTADALELILINLISNGIKYSAKGSQIDIFVCASDSCAEISVKDQGRGISSENLETIFNRFSRVTEPQSETTLGTGIGLALVKELIEANKGSVKVTSVLNQGTTFTISLPLYLGDIPKAQFISPQTSHYGQLELDVLKSADMPLPEIQITTSVLRQTVLLIDDNADMLTILQQSLKAEFDCLLAHNGEQGLSLAMQHIPDIIVCDVMMPGISGFEVAQRLKSMELCCHIPLILLTAKGDIQSKLTGWKADIDEYMVKPFNGEELLIRVQNLLSIRQLLKKRFAHTLFQQPGVVSAQGGLTDKDRTFVERLEKVLEQHHSDAQLSRLQVAQFMLISERQLHRKMDALLDQNLTEYLRRYRLKKAADLLQTSGLQVGQICEQCGFGSSSYFAKYFKAEFGVTPKQYQSNKNKATSPNQSNEERS